MREARNNDELRAKICLAYDVIVNRDYYSEIKKNTYEIKKKCRILLLCHWRLL